MPELAEAEVRDLVGVLERAAKSDFGVTFVDRSEQEQRVPYAALLEAAREVAGGLYDTGLRPGDRIALVLPTGPEFFEAFFGALIAGLAPVPLYPPVRLGRLDEYHDQTSAMLRACRARAVLCDRRTRRVLGVAVERAGLDLGAMTVDALPRRRAEREALDCDALAFIQFSSGTTVAPKPVCLSHRQILSNISAILGTILHALPEGPDAPHRCVSWLPLYHDMGLIGSALTAIARPAELVLIAPEDFVTKPALWLRAISRHRGTISPAPNFAYALCADRIRDEDLEGVDLSCWKVAMNGAEPATPAVLSRFVDRFGAWGLPVQSLTPVYGLAEASLAVTFSDLRERFHWEIFDIDALCDEGIARRCEDGHTLVSLGAPLPGYALRITDDDGEVLGEDRVGRIHVRGPSIMMGYDGMRELSAEVLDRGWLDTGDTGFVRKGELYICGRAKDTIVLRGRNHAPQDIEQKVDAVAGVRTGCVAAVGIVAPGGDGEELVLLVEHRRGFAGRRARLAEAVSRQVAREVGLVPARVEVLAPGTLPRTSSGKLRRAEARRLLLAGRLRRPARATLLHLGRQMLRSKLSFARARRR